MFVCRECMKRFSQSPSIGQSYGPCELCERVAGCSDIPSKYLTFRREWARENMTPEYFAILDSEGIISQ